MYQGTFGHKYIKIPNYALDFSAEFVFLGFTKTGRIRLGEIYFSGPNEIKWNNRLGRFDGKYLTVCRDNFLKSIEEMEKDAKPKNIRIGEQGLIDDSLLLEQTS